jgi:hypothetical protein
MIVLCRTEILSASLMFVPTGIRTFLLKDTNCEMLRTLIAAFCTTTDEGIMEQLCDIIKTIVDSDLDSVVQV